MSSDKVLIPMQPVIQEEKTGCAIASVAAIAGVSYQQARRVAAGLGIYAHDSLLWSETDYIRRLLQAFAIRSASGETAFTGWHALPDCALLSIKWHMINDRAYWHWVVFVRESENSYVLDSKASLKNPVRTDFGRIKPKWYIAIEPAGGQ